MVWLHNTHKKLHEIMKHITSMTLLQWLDAIGIILSWLLGVSFTTIAISDVVFIMCNHYASIALTVFQYSTITFIILLMLLIIIAFIRANHE